MDTNDTGTASQRVLANTPNGDDKSRLPPITPGTYDQVMDARAQQSQQPPEKAVQSS